jgi:hypothetical protein
MLNKRVYREPEDYHKRIPLWRSSEFLKLWIGQTISEIGSRITPSASLEARERGDAIGFEGCCRLGRWRGISG